MDCESRRLNLDHFAESLGGCVELWMAEEAADVLGRIGIFYCHVDNAVAGMAEVWRPEIPIVGEERGPCEPVQDGYQIGISCALLREMLSDHSDRDAPAPELSFG